ncbi:hypothetical protein TEA_004224 [Camellia sinensis var. sinensis]|uniref:Uncharacterized protein n=1 Tax=Camellia sinensis var. sinensis TaxID=542762 RepID=A0A4S4EUX6_CAMSN|nr:hypothetical protein TEA_004224 [Camellia sinensis var. sinensis]
MGYDGGEGLQWWLKRKVVVVVAWDNRQRFREPPTDSWGLRDIFRVGFSTAIRRAVVIGNGVAGAENQCTGLVRALGSAGLSLVLEADAKQIATMAHETFKKPCKTVDSIPEECSLEFWKPQNIFLEKNSTGDPNPHMGHLAWADAFIITADSVSMLSEACSTGKPVYVIGAERCTWKFAEFHKSLQERGVVRPFTGKEDISERWSYPPLNDTAEASFRVIEALSEHGWRLEP